MKFVYLGYDFFLDAVHRLRDDGHELAGIYSFDCDNVFNFNTATADLARRIDIPFTLKKPLEMDIEAFITQGVECFFSAGYLYKIPPVPEDKAYGVNFHPSLLPQGRGIMPSPTILMEQPHVAGYTLHKMTRTYDAGDILLQEAIELDDNDDVETYSAKLVMRGQESILEVFSNMKFYWNGATAQDESKASTFAKPDQAMRTLNWNDSNQAIERKARAFGRYGCLARFDNAQWAVYNLKCWKEEHSLTPGDVALVMSREIVIATREGFAILKELQKIA